MPVIANTTVISNFSSIEQLELLHLLWDRVYLSDQVFAEIQAGFVQGYNFYAGIEQVIFPFSARGWLHLTALSTTDEFRLFGQLRNMLHDGEASSIALAHYRQWTFLSDDKAARKACLSLKVPVTGTLGILLALVKHQYRELAAVDSLLQQMRVIGYRSPVTSLNEILEQ
jgi:predicted nucleic acid-binding protein